MHSVWILINKITGERDWIVGVFRSEREARAKMMQRVNRQDRPDSGSYEIEEHFVEEVWTGGEHG